MKLTTHHHEIPMVRISVPPLTLYVFMGWAGKTVCVCVYIYIYIYVCMYVCMYVCIYLFIHSCAVSHRLSGCKLSFVSQLSSAVPASPEALNTCMPALYNRFHAGPCFSVVLALY